MKPIPFFSFCLFILLLINCATIPKNFHEQSKNNALLITYYSQLQIQGRISFSCSTYVKNLKEIETTHELVFDELNRIQNDNWYYTDGSSNFTTYKYTNSSISRKSAGKSYTIDSIFKKSNYSYDFILYDNGKLFGQGHISNIIANIITNTYTITDSKSTVVSEYHFLSNGFIDYWVEKHKNDSFEISIIHQYKYTNNYLSEIISYDTKKTYEKILFFYDERNLISQIIYYDENLQMYKKESRIN
jgi:hypothetical protein